MITHISRTGQFYPPSSRQEKLSDRQGQKQNPPSYGVDFADQQLQPMQAVMKNEQSSAYDSNIFGLWGENNVDGPIPTLQMHKKASSHSNSCACSACSLMSENEIKASSTVQTKTSGDSSGETENVIQLMCDKGHEDHPDGPCPDYSYQSGQYIGGDVSSISSPQSPQPASFSAAERLAIAGMEESQELGKLAQHRDPAASRGEVQPLIPMSDALKKERLKGLKGGALKEAGKTVIDKASGQPVSAVGDAVSKGIDAAKLSAPSGSGAEGYERIEDDPVVEESYELFPKLFGKNVVGQGAAVAGGLGGAAIGSAVAPGIGTVVGGKIGSKLGGAGAKKAAGVKEDYERAKYLVKQLHILAREGHASAFAQLKGLGLDDETIMANDGWKAAIDKLPK